MLRTTLDRMAAGGLRDQLGGGFHRYSTDGQWLAPHFEQMLYDNAQLARAYLHAWQLLGNPGDRAVACAVFDAIVRDFTTAGGGLAASRDADTDGVEGATFTWTPGEVAAALADDKADDLALVLAAWDVTDAGNWHESHGRTILRRVRTDAELAETFGLAPADVRERLERARVILLAARDRRPQPNRDDKVLAGWNGLAIAASPRRRWPLALAGDQARADRYRDAAIGAASVCLGGLLDANGRLWRSWKDGRATGAGVLEDYACLAEGLLALYGATFDERWFRAARGLAEAILARFADPAGGFFDTAADHEVLITRPKDLQDNAVPSGNAMAVTVLLRLAALTGEGRYRDAAEAGLRLVAELAPRHPTFFGQWLVALDFALAEVDEIAIVGDVGLARNPAPPGGGGGRLPPEPGRRADGETSFERDRAARRPVPARRPADGVRLPWVRLPPARDGAGGARCTPRPPAAGARPMTEAARPRPARSSDARQPVLARPAATVVLLRPGSDPTRPGPEVLLTLRPDSMAFGGGLHVFPGGRVDPGDGDPRILRRSRGGDPDRVAALRELFEEAGVLVADRADGSPAGSDPGLAAELPHLRAAVAAGELDLAAILERFELTLATDRLVPIARWQTPRAYPRRFDTRFFAVELPAGAELDLDPREVAGHSWLTPSAALGAMAAGEIQLWPPTSTTLQRLEHAPDIAAVRAGLVPIEALPFTRETLDGDSSDWPGAAPSGRPAARRTRSSSAGSGSWWSIRAIRTKPSST